MDLRFGQITAGVVVGAVLTVLFYEGSAAPAPVPVAPAAAAKTGEAAPPEGRARGASVPVASDVHEALERLRTENQVLRGQLDMFGGSEVEWPDHPAYHPAGVEALVAEVLPEVPVAYDCEEFPCIVSLRLSGEASRKALDDRAREVWMSLNEAVAPGLPPDIKAQWYTYTTVAPDGSPVVITTFYPEDVAAQLESRVEQRLERLQEEAGEGDAAP